MTPDYFTLFQRCVLMPEHCQKEILKYLRFFKNEGGYQGYLSHYLPLLPAEVIGEFLPDVALPELKAKLAEKLKPAKEEKTEDVKEPRKVKKSSPSTDVKNV